MNITPVHPKPEKAANMPYAPAIEVRGGSTLLFLSGAIASPLYHKHPHVPEEHVLPDDIREQTRRVMENIKLVLDTKGLTFRHVVQVTKYLTDIREAEAMQAVVDEYFGDWKPTSTLLGINNLSAPGARVELTMVAVIPD